jgi:hypothetical protein
LQPGAPADIDFADGDLADGLPRPAERALANTRRDEIAQAMWVQYQEELGRRAAE